MELHLRTHPQGISNGTTSLGIQKLCFLRKQSLRTQINQAPMSDLLVELEPSSPNPSSLQSAGYTDLNIDP